jgi:hypothetical protein
MILFKTSKKSEKKGAESLLFGEETNNLIQIEEKAVSLQDSG